MPLLPIPPFFRLLLPGFRPLWESIIHLLRGLPAPLPPASPSHLQPWWPWPSMPGPLVLTPHLRAPLSPSMWLSSPSPCMSGTDATRSFKKSNCCSSSMHCFLKEVRRGWHLAGPRCLNYQQGTARSSGCQENGAWKTSTTGLPPFAGTPSLSSPSQTHQSLRPCWPPSSLLLPYQDTTSLKCVNAWGRSPLDSSSSTATHRWDVVIVLAFRDWVTWQAFFNSDSRKSSSARAHRRQGERGSGAPAHTRRTRAASFPHVPQPDQPPTGYR